jgi:hypothetical protein
VLKELYLLGDVTAWISPVFRALVLQLALCNGRAAAGPFSGSRVRVLVSVWVVAVLDVLKNHKEKGKIHSTPFDSATYVCLQLLGYSPAYPHCLCATLATLLWHTPCHCTCAHKHDPLGPHIEALPSADCASVCSPGVSCARREPPTRADQEHVCSSRRRRARQVHSL